MKPQNLSDSRIFFTKVISVFGKKIATSSSKVFLSRSGWVFRSVPRSTVNNYEGEQKNNYLLRITKGNLYFALLHSCLSYIWVCLYVIGLHRYSNILSARAFFCIFVYFKYFFEKRNLKTHQFLHRKIIRLASSSILKRNAQITNLSRSRFIKVKQNLKCRQTLTARELSKKL